MMPQPTPKPMTGLTAASDSHDITLEPMSYYVRILARGKLGSRNYTGSEAFDTMTHIIKGSASDVQIGAVLMLLRVKEETPEELTGFVRAVKSELAQRIGGPLQVAADLDWPSYAGKRRQHAWYLLAALCLAAHGKRVFMHGARGHTQGRVYSEDLLHELGIPAAADFTQAKKQLDERHFCFMPTRAFSPVLARLVDLRGEFGVRSPVHTLLRLINPTDAPHTLQSIFHPAYQGAHRQAALMLGYQNSLVIKGEGGEFERNPDARVRVMGLRDGSPYEMRLEMINPTRSPTDSLLSASALKQVWLGERLHPYAEQAITQTLALSLISLKLAHTHSQAQLQAHELWANRKQAAHYRALI